MPFGITVAAPTLDALPSDVPVEGYGKDGSQWRPFLTEPRPLAFYAAEQVEQLDFAASVSSVGAVPQVPTHHPGVVLIDPWFVATDEGAETLTALLASMEQWVLPILVDAAPGNPRKAEFAARARDIVRSTGPLGTEPARAAAQGITTLSDFVSLMPRLVAEAERRYLRYSSKPRPKQSRPSLGGDISGADGCSEADG
jgi:FxsC-like protein